MSAPLDGVGLFGIRLPPASECWPELSADSQAVLRRTNPNRRYESPSRVCSGEDNPNRNWCLPPLSALLDGVALFGIHLPPASKCWPELSAYSQSVLRRTTSNRSTGSPPRISSGETNPNRSYCLPPVSALLTGGEIFGIRPPPAGEYWPELGERTDAVLRRNKPSRRSEHPSRTTSGRGRARRSCAAVEHPAANLKAATIWLRFH